MTPFPPSSCAVSESVSGIRELPVLENGFQLLASMFRYPDEPIWQALAETEAYTVLGGGDSITATEKYDLVGKMGYLCTGGGALIRFLTGEELPVVKALRYAAKTFPAEMPEE